MPKSKFKINKDCKSFDVEITTADNYRVRYPDQKHYGPSNSVTNRYYAINQVINICLKILTGTT